MAAIARRGVHGGIFSQWQAGHHDEPDKKPPRERPFWRLVWRIAVTVILGAIGAAAGFYTESLLNDAPRLPEQIRDAPGVVRIVIIAVIIAVIVIVIALVILSYFWGKKPVEDEEETIGPRLDELATTGQEIKRDAEETNQRLIVLAGILTHEAPAIPATVRASSLPRPANLTGRDQTLGDLMAARRAGR